MAEAVDEGILYDLLTKRRAGKFTADDLLWVADHPTIISGLRSGKLKTVPVDEGVSSVIKVVFDWQKLFGHLGILDSHFNESIFPLEPEDRLRPVIRKQFSDRGTGYERLRWAASQGLELALPRATGLELKANPQLEMHVVFGGGQWQDRFGQEFVPGFCRCSGGPLVYLYWLGSDFGPCVWLFSPRKSGT